MTVRTTYRYNDNWDCEILAPGSNQKMSWGEPALIMQTKFDRCCPRCSAIPGEGYKTKSGRIIPGGFELIFDETDDFGARARCVNCGWSF